MALTEKDILAKPVVKKPKTLNPLGAIFYALMLGGGHTLFYNSFIITRYQFGVGFGGVTLAIVGTFFLIVAISLSTKITLFTIRIDKSKSISAQTALQIVYFYIGFVPVYGFSIVYFQKTLELWHIFVISGCLVVFFVLLVLFNIRLMKNDEANLGDLKDLFYQPKKTLIIILSLLATTIVTAILFIF